MLRWGIIGALLCLATPAFAANRIELRADKSRLTTADLLHVEVVLTMENEGAVSDVRMPDFDGFRIVSRNSSSQHFTSIQNFKMTSSKTVTTSFVLEPTGAGVFVLGPARFTEGGQLVESQRLEITVAELRADTRSPGTGEAGLAAPLSPRELESPNIFIRLIPEKAELFQGEQMTATVYVYIANVSVSRVSPVAAPSFPGFLADELQLPEGDRARRIIIGRNSYHVEPVARFLLTAQQTGEQTLNPYRLKVLINDGQFFGGRWGQFASDPVAVRVSPLPDEGRPSGFLNAHVGRFALSASVDRYQTEAGQPVTLTVVLNGNTNMDRVALPRLPAIPGARVFPPTESKQSWQEGDRLVGRRVAEYLVVPGEPGQFRIPSMSFAYYDTDAQGYRNLSTPDFTIVATAAGSVPGGAPAPAFQKQDLFASEDSLRPFAPRAELENRNGRFFGSLLFVALFWGPLALVALVWATDAGRWLLRRRAGDARSFREREARSLAAELSRTAERPDKAFAALLARWIVLRLELLFDAPFGGLTHDQLAEALAGRGLAPESVAALLEILRTCDLLRYAPGASGDGRSLLGRAEGWFREVGR